MNQFFNFFEFLIDIYFIADILFNFNLTYNLDNVNFETDRK